MVSSSRPSSPRKTRARPPRAARTSAITGAIRRSAQPTAAATGRAGLVSGPRKLKTVGMPISRRGAPACRMPGWNTGAKKNPMPASCTQRATAGAGRSIATPSASSTSAAPEDDDAARPPCLATGTPAPAVTTAAIVEMFTVWAPSPPVPTMSTHSRARSTGVAWASISAARPVTSSADSPLARSATAKAATWTGVASPVITSRMAHTVSVGREVLAGQEPLEQRRPGGPAGTVRRSSAAHRRKTGRCACCRSRSATTPGAVSGSTGRGSVPSARDQCASHRSACRAMRTHTAGRSATSCSI